MRERMKRWLCLVLSLTAAVGLMLVRDSAAWIKTSAGSALGQTIHMKQLAFEFEGEIGSFLQYDPQTPNSYFIITGENLIRTGKLFGVNHSTLPTELRFMVKYTSPATGTAAEYSGTGGILTVEAASGWTFNSEDHYFYYSGGSSQTPSVMGPGSTADADNDGEPDGTSFDILEDIQFSESALNTALSTNEHAATTGDLTSTGKIVVGIQARQSDNMQWGDVTWTNLATIVSS